MPKRYAAGPREYLGAFLESSDPIFGAPNVPILGGSPLGDSPYKIKVGRIPLPFDFRGWFWDGLRKIFYPPAPPKPTKQPASKAGGNDQAAFPAYALSEDDLSALEKQLERELARMGYRIE